MKKILTLVCLLGLALGAWAQIDASQVQYWIGSGPQSATVAVYFDEEDMDDGIVIVWGLRWNEDEDGWITVADALELIATNDSRFSYHIRRYMDTPYGLEWVAYNDGTLDLRSGNSAVNSIQIDGNNYPANEWEDFASLEDGSQMEVSTGGYYVASETIYPGVPSTPVATDATIAADDILFWVGEGDSYAILNIESGNTSLAWGYRFDADDEPTVFDMITAIDAADPRLAYSMSWTTYKMFFSYREYPLSLSLDEFRFKVDGELADDDDEFSDYDLANGTYVKISDSEDDLWTVAVSPASVVAMPINTTIDASNIRYWVGEGSNQAVIAINWGSPDTALAWGLRFDDISVRDALNAIVDADPRLSSNYLADFTFTHNGETLTWNAEGRTSVMQFILDGNPNAGLTSSLSDGSFLKVGESAYGIGVDSTCSDYGCYPAAVYWSAPNYPVSLPIPDEATIAADSILFWVGEGDNQVVLAINWADSALAWDYRFGTDYVTMQDMMDDIVAADPRLSIAISGGYLTDINFVENGINLAVSSNSWWSNYVNGSESAGMAAYLHDGDFTRWADPVAGIVTDSTSYEWDGQTYTSYTYVFPMEIHPVSVPEISSDTTTTDTTQTQPQHGPFCGPVGTEDCTAIAANNSTIVDWATTCVVTRGPANIAIANSPMVTYGNDTMAIGPVSLSDNLNVVSLGDGGSALLTFAGHLTNGEGPDFAVFENSFNDAFLELAFVEVSTDGETFVRFPASSFTQTETQISDTGSIDPTNINNLAGKFRKGYGTPFDLEELRGAEGINIDSINYVRIVDVVGSIDPQYATRDAEGRIINDPWPTNGPTGGFDLAGVGAINIFYDPVDTTSTDTTVVVEEATIDASDILYWIGEGDDEAIFVLDIDGHAYAWGYRFDADDELTAEDMIIDIDSRDPRFNYTQPYGSSVYLFSFVEYPVRIQADPNTWKAKVNGYLASTVEMEDIELQSGMVVKVSNDSNTVWSTPIEPATVAEMPVDTRIAASDILYWVGTGSKQAIVAISWASPEKALAWGVRWEGNATISAILDSLNTTDPRLTIDANNGFINSISFTDSLINLSTQPAPSSYVQFSLSGIQGLSGNATMHNNDFLKIGESAFGTGYDSTMSYGSWYPEGVVWATEIEAVPAPYTPDTNTTDTTTVVDATIAADSVLYWLGEGNNRVVIAFNWADSALAWGYRFGTDSVTVSTIVEAIATADPRFSTVGSTSFYNDFLFYDSTTADTLRLTPSDDWSTYWNLNVNGESAMLGADQMKVGNGDFVKWADISVGVIVDSTFIDDGTYQYWQYTYAYPMEIHPVSVPRTNGIATIVANKVEVYPNPASDRIKVVLTSNQVPTDAVLYDMSGREVMRHTMPAGSNSLQLNINSLQQGIYVLRVGGAATRVAITR